MIDASLVRRLIADQFPLWAHLEVWPVEFDGHDNRTFHLGDKMSARMPTRDKDAAHITIEQEWLPKLGPQLPLPIPVPVGKGSPGPGYPFPWSVNSWVPGHNALPDRIADLAEFAKDLADFLNALQLIGTTGAPGPGRHTYFRGCDPSVYDSDTRTCIEELRSVIDPEAATSVWEAALEARFDGPPVWFHGDVSADNLLVDEAGRLCAVIDFGQTATGDPACDVTIAWTLFTGRSREVFRAGLAVDEATWARGRGWGLWKALLKMRQRTSLPGGANPGCIARDILAEAP